MKHDTLYQSRKDRFSLRKIRKGGVGLAGVLLGSLLFGLAVANQPTTVHADVAGTTQVGNKQENIDKTANNSNKNITNIVKDQQPTVSKNANNGQTIANNQNKDNNTLNVESDSITNEEEANTLAESKAVEQSGNNSKQNVVTQKQVMINYEEKLPTGERYNNGYDLLFVGNTDHWKAVYINHAIKGKWQGWIKAKNNIIPAYIPDGQKYIKKGYQVFVINPDGSTTGSLENPLKLGEVGVSQFNLTQTQIDNWSGEPNYRVQYYPAQPTAPGSTTTPTQKTTSGSTTTPGKSTTPAQPPNAQPAKPTTPAQPTTSSKADQPTEPAQPTAPVTSDNSNSSSSTSTQLNPSVPENTNSSDNNASATQTNSSVTTNNNSSVATQTQPTTPTVSNTNNDQVTNNSSVSTKVIKPAIKRLVLTHNAFVYTKSGHLSKKNGRVITWKRGRNVSASSKIVMIGSKKFYKVGKNAYIKVSNTVEKKLRAFRLTRNAKVYKLSRGKMIAIKNASLKKGFVVKALYNGNGIKNHGAVYYCIGKNRYIKAGNTISKK